MTTWKRAVAAFAVVLWAAAWSAPAAADWGGDKKDDKGTTASAVGQARDLLRQMRYGDAVPILTAAIDANGNDADAWNLLGFATRKLGRAAEAESHYKRALALDPEHKGALEYLGLLYVETGRLDDAKALLARLDGICLFGCQEYDDLKRAVATGRVGDH